MEKLVQKIDYKLRKAVLDYHDYHGDKDVEIVGFVCDPVGESMIHTRVTDENGKPVSCLLQFYYNGDWNISEYDGLHRECEHCLLQDYMNGREDYDGPDEDI